jgi:hypothetical protein
MVHIRGFWVEGAGCKFWGFGLLVKGLRFRLFLLGVKNIGLRV